jgi:hypothetical protein
MAKPESDIVERLNTAYAKVAEWPENSETGFMDLITLRNLVPEAADLITALRTQAHEEFLFRRATQRSYDAMEERAIAAESELARIRSEIGEPVAWIRDGFLDELHKDGSHSGSQTVLWLDERNAGKRHTKRIPIFAITPTPDSQNPLSCTNGETGEANATEGGE